MVIFYDRVEELRRIREFLAKPGFGLMVIYGRRRVGKTALALKATEGLRRLYFLAVGRGDLARFKRAAADVDPEARYVAEDWEALFAFLANRVDVVIIDEFPNLIEADKRIVSVFQAVVDQILSKTNVKLILMGSSVSVMTSKVLSYKSPLYGRRTASLEVKPVPFLQYRHFFPDKPARELVEIHGFAGGIPHYMVRIRGPFWQFLEEELENRTFLLDEGDFLLRYEFAEVSTYRLILEAIASGRATLGEIKDYAGMKGTDLTPYLRNLAAAGFVKKARPVLGRGRYRYYLSDFFLSFWFRFISPNLSAIEEGLYTAEDIRKDYDAYLGRVFEEVARELVAREMRAGRLPRAQRLGPQWWTSREGAREIDLLGLGRGAAVVVEVKWSDDVDAEEVAEELLGKAAELPLPKRVVAVVVARSFSKRVDNYRGVEVAAYDLSDVDRALREEAGATV